MQSTQYSSHARLNGTEWEQIAPFLDVMEVEIMLLFGRADRCTEWSSDTFLISWIHALLDCAVVKALRVSTFEYC